MWRSSRWPPLANAAALVADCESLAPKSESGHIPDTTGRPVGDRSRTNEVPRDFWPATLRALTPEPRHVRVDGDHITIFQAAGAFGSWGLLVCLSDHPCTKHYAELVSTTHPR